MLNNFRSAAAKDRMFQPANRLMALFANHLFSHVFALL